MVPIKGTISGVRETISAFAGIPSLLRQAGQAAMTESLELFSKTLRNDFLQGPYPEFVERRTGSFRATFQRGNPQNIWSVQASGTQILGIFGSSDRRGRVLNEGSGYLPGGVIRSSRPGGFLAVRTEFTKTAAGVVREKYRGPLRGLPHTFVRPIRARHAKAAVFERIGRRVIPIAWLVESVKIVGRRFMENTRTAVEPKLPAIFQQKFDTVLTRLQDTLRRVGR